MLSDAEKQKLIYQEQVRFVYSQSPVAAISGLVMAALLGALLWSVVNPAYIVAWFSFLTLVVVARYNVVNLFHKNNPPIEEYPFWEYLLTALLFFLGIGWGSAGVFLFPVDSPLHQLIIVQWLIGFVGTIMALYSSLFKVAFVAIISALTPISIHFFILGDPLSFFMGISAIAYGGIMSASMYKANSYVVTSIEQNIDLQEEIEERHRVEAALNETKRQADNARKVAEEATKLKDMYVNLVSHDLRAPLGSIIGFSELLGKEKSHDLGEEDRLMILKKITNTAEGLTNLIDQLLDIGRLQTGSIKPKKRSVNGYNLVNATMDHLKYHADTKGVIVANEVDKDVKLFVDHALFSEVINNLITNGIKFASRGDTVTIYSPQEEGVTLAIKDTGAGIEEGLIADIFRHEVKTSTIGTAGEIGTGLGLPYSLDIIKAHGGSMSIESEPGKGSVFYINLPEAPTTILIVDDQEAQRAIIRTHLESIGQMEFIEAENGEDALNQIDDIVPDLIITDLNMPKMDGFAFLEAVRKNAATADIPVIVVTSAVGEGGLEETNFRNRVIALGANDFLVKPFNPDEFILKAHAFIEEG